MQMQAHTEWLPPILVDRVRAASLLGISVRSLDQLIRTNRITVKRVGRRTLVPYDALVQFGQDAGSR
jgi:excisionase family DNA binding protein